MINFDHNASSDLDPRVASEVSHALGGHANPSSIHTLGQKGKFLVEEARSLIKKALGMAPGDKVIFTSGATEANNHVVMGVYWRERCNSGSGKPAIIVSAIEHPSVLEPAKRLQSVGWNVESIPVSSNGTIDIDRDLLPILSKETKLVSLMFANNETGVLLPIKEVVNVVRVHAPKALTHCDAVQALGRVPLNFSELAVDLMTLSAHKIGGIKGAGALLIREGVSLPALILGGAQEKHERAGTENVSGIISLGLAVQYATADLKNRIASMSRSLAVIKQALQENIPKAIFHCEGSPSLPNTLSVHLPGISADDLVVALDLKGIAISSGAACASGKPEPSHVLMALGLSNIVAKETVRISVGAGLKEAQVTEAAKLIVATIGEMKR